MSLGMLVISSLHATAAWAGFPDFFFGLIVVPLLVGLNLFVLCSIYKYAAELRNFSFAISDQSSGCL